MPVNLQASVSKHVFAEDGWAVKGLENRQAAAYRCMGNAADIMLD